MSVSAALVPNWFCLLSNTLHYSSGLTIKNYVALQAAVKVMDAYNLPLYVNHCRIYFLLQPLPHPLVTGSKLGPSRFFGTSLFFSWVEVGGTGLGLETGTTEGSCYIVRSGIARPRLGCNTLPFVLHEQLV